MPRKNKSGGALEAIFGLLMMVSVMGVFNPKLREQLVSTLQTIFAVLLLCSLVGLIYFLYRQIKKSREPAAQPLYRATSKIYNSYTPAYSSALKEAAELLPIEPTEWDETILESIEWKRFEVVCKEFFLMTGFEPRETKIGADGGVDIRIYKVGSETSGKPEAIVQCKAWNTYKVGVKLVRELFGIMAAEKVERGIIITSSEFTTEAKEFAEGKELVLMSGNSFLQQIRKLPAEKQQRLLDVALEGDYKTPTCPQCDIKMKLREGRSGKNPGSKFWGCVRYPRCRQTLIYKEKYPE